jgi:hypothetical protein
VILCLTETVKGRKAADPVMVVARVKAVGLVKIRAERLARVLVPKKAERRVSVDPNATIRSYQPALSVC